MRTPRFLILLLAAAVFPALGSLGYWAHQRQSAARRLAAWKAEQEEDAPSPVMAQAFTWDRGELTLGEFAELITAKSGLPVEIDDDALIAAWRGLSKPRDMMVHVPRDEFTLGALLKMVLYSEGLAADVRGQRLTITTLDRSADHTHLRTVVYPLPQPEPSGLDEEGWKSLLSVNLGAEGHAEAVPGAVVVVDSAEGHRRIRRVIDAVCHLDDWPNQSVVIPPPEPSAARQEILEALNARTNCELVETPLKDTFRFLAERHGIPIVVMVKKLQEAGVHVDTPMTKNLHDISLRSALNLILGELDLTFFVDDEAIIITTPEDAENRIKIVAYPVLDLLVPGERLDFTSLIELLTTHAPPETWDDGSGPGPIDSIAPNWLIVKHTDYVQEWVGTFLNQLRTAIYRENMQHVISLFPGSEREQRIRSALQPQLDFELTDVPLKDAISFLADSLNIPIVVNAKKLNEAGVDIDTPVNLTLSHTSAELGLRLILEQLELTYVIRDEVLQITTPEDAENQLITRLYDARGLQPLFPSERQLRELVQHLVQPGTRRRGSIDIFRGILFATETEGIQRDLEQLLAAFVEHCIDRPEGTAERAWMVRVDAHPDDVAQLEAALEKIISVEVMNVSLSEALEELAKKHNLSVVLDRQGLVKVSVAPATEVSITADDVTLGGVLDRLLEPLGLGYVVRENVLWCSALNECEYRWPVTRLYRVDDLANSKPRGAGDVEGQIKNLLPPVLGVQVVGGDWVAVAAPRSIQSRVADWLTEQRTGEVPKRELERRALEKELEGGDGVK